MEKNDIKNLLLIAIGVYLVFGYILGSLNPFDSKTMVRLIQVVIFTYLSYLYFDNKK
jgi:hypothetical protein